MSFRTLVVAYEESGYQVDIRLCQPCLIVEINGEESGPFYNNVEAARAGATRTIKQKLKEKASA